MASLVSVMASLAQAGVELYAEAGSLRYRSPSALPPELLDQLRARREVLTQCLGARREQLSSFALTPAQRQLWALAQMWTDRRGELAYVETLSLVVEGTLERSALLGALAQLVARHQALRLELESDGASQTVVPCATPVIVEVGAAAQVGFDAVMAGLEAELVVPQSLDRAPRLRLLVADLDGDTWLTFASHHSVCDGESLALVAHELQSLYSAGVAGELATLAPAVPFERYVERRAALRAGARGDSDRAHWIQRLGNGLGAAVISPRVRHYRGGRIVERLPISWSALAHAAAAARVTPFALTLAIWSRAVAGSQQEALLVAVALDGRGATGCVSAVGYCSEVFPVWVDAQQGPIAQAGQRAHRALFEALAHPACSLADLGEHWGRRATASIAFGATMLDVRHLQTFAGRSARLRFAPAPYRDVALALALYRTAEDDAWICCDFSRDQTSEDEARMVLQRAATSFSRLGSDV